MTIRDARAQADLSLDREGFVLAERPTAVRDFYNARRSARGLLSGSREAADGDYRGACGRKYSSMTCAATRWRSMTRRCVRQCAMIHDDYTAKSSPERIRLYLPDEAEALISRRYAIINVWRAIRGPSRQRRWRCAMRRAWGRKICCRPKKGSSTRFINCASSGVIGGTTFRGCGAKRR